MVSPRGRVRGDSNQTEPFQHSNNCLDENEWGGNLFLPQHVNNFFDETSEVPSLGYVIGHINAISFPIAIDTGAGKSLLNEETWKIIMRKIQRISPPKRSFLKKFSSGNHFNDFSHFREKTYLTYSKIHITRKITRIFR